MAASEVHVVTGAFGYTGRYIARRLLERGVQVRTLTNSAKRRCSLSGQVSVLPLCFDDPDRLADSLRGATVLYNTYWVRFNHTTFRHATAVHNTLRLFEAARRAGIHRVVHVSITNPSHDSPYEYFRGKAVLERALIASGLSYAVLRPAVVFGREDILINNIAWILRRFPVFGVFGDGGYKLQPIYVEDLANLAVTEGLRDADVIVDAIGPETFRYRDLVRQIGSIVGVKRPVTGVPAGVGWAIGWGIGKVLGDVVITREEIGALMAGLLHTKSSPVGSTSLTEWATHHAACLGRRYHSELARRKDLHTPYVTVS